MSTRLGNPGRSPSHFEPSQLPGVSAPELLRAARRILRSRTRAPRYWAAADRLSDLWLGGPLRSSSEFQLAASADLGAVIDWLYDEPLSSSASAAEELVGLTGRLQEMVDFEKALALLRRFETAPLEPEAELVEATRAIIATLTVHGYATLHGRGSAELATRWLEAWADAMWRQNVQQQQTCGFGLLARLPPGERPACMARLGLTPEDLMPRSTSFSEGVEEFLERYGETAASTVAVLGGLPFSTLPTSEVEALLRLCTGEAGLLTPISRLLRLAPDVSFDPAEAMNTGVFASAAEQRRSVLEVVSEGKLSKPELDARLGQEWARFSVQARRLLEERMATHAEQVGPEVASGWLPALYTLLERLVPGTWKG
ncbi:hypothetical protein JRI60_21840 [Archangium violaceum]|uniref:hypothetical protein n=1 Tax=Archangium violaceum TaxID=83451 RepID=UPI00194F603C|nr:hypothetical protein [Archangium violaceum]QRO01471.1 hypothetical protein JRI60_21840 [Archangium violaceum]